MPAVSEYGRLVSILEAASARMAQRANMPYLDGFLYEMTGTLSLDIEYENNTFLTDRPEELPFPETVYHVAGGNALEQLQKGKRLIPTETHFLADVATDKGLLVHMVPTFMEVLDIKVNNLRQFLFSAPQIDADQVAHFNKTAGTDVNAKAFDLFLTRDSTGTVVLNQDLKEVLEALDQNKKPFEIDHLRKKVDDFVRRMFDIPNIREGWLNQIRDRLYGIVPIEIGRYETLVDRAEYWLTTSEQMHREHTQIVPAPAVVLEIDTRELITLTAVNGLFPVLLGDRPIESIFPSVTIVPGAVKKAYVDPSVMDAFSTGSIPLASLDTIPEELWLGGVDWRQARSDMNNPLCAIRYTLGKSTTWREIADRGLIAPAKTIVQNDLFTPPMILLHLFGSETFSFTQEKLFQDFPLLYADEIAKQYAFVEGVFNRI